MSKRTQIVAGLIAVGVLAALLLVLNPRLRCVVTGGDWREPAKSRAVFPPPGVDLVEWQEEQARYRMRPDFCDY